MRINIKVELFLGLRPSGTMLRTNFLNARIATYVRALERFKADKITPEEVYEKLEEYGIDYWANPRDKFRENNEIKKKSSARRWNPTIKFTNVFEKKRYG